MSKSIFAQVLSEKARKEAQKIRCSEEYKELTEQYLLEQIRRIGAADEYSAYNLLKEELRQTRAKVDELEIKAQENRSILGRMFSLRLPNFPPGGSLYNIHDWAERRMEEDELSYPMITRLRALENLSYNKIMLQLSLATGSKGLQEALNAILEKFGWTRDGLE